MTITKSKSFIESVKKKNITMLLMGTAKSGKTTIVGSLSKTPDDVTELSSPSVGREQIITDWKFVPGAKNIELSKLEFNSKALFGKNLNSAVEVYNKQLEDNYEYLHDLLRFDYRKCSSEQLVEYVDNMGKYIVEKCKAGKIPIKDIVLKRKSATFIRKLEIIVPPSFDFENLLNEKRLTSFTLREAKGILDFTEESIKELGILSCKDLGLDNIDAAMILCQSSEFVNNFKNWYKNIYHVVLCSIPIFVSARYDGMIERWEDNEDGEICKFINSIMNNRKLFSRLEKTHLSNAKNLLKYCGINDYDITKSSYLIPTIVDLYDNDITLNELMGIEDSEYCFYRNVIFNNFKDIIDKTLKYSNLLDDISKSDINMKIIDMFNDNVNSFDMYPKYNKYSRDEVNQNIVDKSLPILGENGALVTVSHGKVKYLAAVTSAITTIVWISKLAELFSLDSKIINTQLTIDEQETLVKKYIMNQCYKNIDTETYFRDYVLFDRYKIEDAIKKVQTNENNDESLDSLSAVIKSIITEELFK